MSLRFAPLAEEDLIDIGLYTEGQWGKRQKNRYLRALRMRCEELKASPELGRPCHALYPGLRRLEENRHTIFYLREGANILIVRILHQRASPLSMSFTR